MSKILALIIAIVLSIITVLADFFVKRASLEKIIWNKWLILWAIIYWLTAIGWVFVMKNMKLSTLWVVYGISCIILLTLVSIFIFNEKVNIFEIIGILLWIMSIVLLYRFS